MKTCVAGVGKWGKNLVKTLHPIGKLTAVVEVNAELRGELSEKYPDVTCYKSIEQLIDSDIPTAFVAVPAPLHFDVSKQLLQAGKDVFVEKPMTLCAADAEELVDIAKNRSAVLMVGHLLIYQSAVRWIKQQLDAGTIGKVLSIHQERCGLGRARSVENVLWSLGVHDIAVAQYLVGSAPVDIEVAGQRAIQPNIEDDIYLHTTYRGGVQSHLHCSWLWPERRRRMTVVGTEGMFVFDELEQTVHLHRKTIGPDLKNIDNGSELVFSDKEQPLKAELKHFLDCVQRRSTPISDGASALEVIRILEQATGRLNK